jgi:hypothetical protein
LRSGTNDLLLVYRLIYCFFCFLLFISIAQAVALCHNPVSDAIRSPTGTRVLHH